MGCLKEAGVSFVGKEGSMNKAMLACIINSEVGAVLAVMRRNVRWGGGSGGASGRYTTAADDSLDHSLIHSLKQLRKQIFTWQSEWREVNPIIYLQPFLDVIRSEETGAPITGVALSSVYKILTLDVIDRETINVDNAMHLVVDAVTSCRFEVTDPASEEVVLMKILQVLLACMRCKASVVLSNQQVCTIVNTCFRIVHQAGSKGELLQRIARHTMHELIRSIFSHLQSIESSEHTSSLGSRNTVPQEADCHEDNAPGDRELGNTNGNSELSAPPASSNLTSSAPVDTVANMAENNAIGVGSGVETSPSDLQVMTEPFGVPCMVEIFQFLCSLLNVVEHMGMNPRSNTIAFEEDVPLFALGLINSAIELGGPFFCQHPSLLNLIQDDLFYNLLRFGSSMSPLILSVVCSIVLNLFHHLRAELKVQLEAFFSNVILRIAQNKYGSSYQQQEVAMEVLVDFCRQSSFMVEMYANIDCDITCTNVFEDLANLLSKSAFPVNSPLSSMHILALDGLVALILGMAERVGNGSVCSEQSQLNHEDYTPVWLSRCDNYNDPSCWVPFVRQKKQIKRKLTTGADHFNRDPKKGLEFLQGTHLLPEKLDPHSVACFFRYTVGLNKNLIGDYLGNHDEFCVNVLHEFARTFDFAGMHLDAALRLFLETFRLPGESQKIQRVLEAFSERYYEQSPQILANKDAALLLSYSLIMLNTDQHNTQVKKKMTEEDFIRNNRRINGGSDLPRDFLSELYHSICKNEIRITPGQGAGFPELTSSHWIYLMHKSKESAPYIYVDSKAYLDYDMFAIVSGPTIAAISVVLDNAEDEDVYQTCIDGFLAVAKICACYNLADILNDLVVSLCNFTTLLNLPSYEESIMAFGDDVKARMATVAVLTIANRYGDYIRTGWRDVLDCILKLHKFDLLPSHLANDTVDEAQRFIESGLRKSSTKSLPATRTPSVSTPRKSSGGLMGRFSQLLYLDTEEPITEPTEEELAARQYAHQTIQECHIDSIFMECKFLHADSLLQLALALIAAAGQPQKGYKTSQDEDTAVFCLELLITITLNNRDRIMLLWQLVYEHIANIVQGSVMPCALVEKAVFGLIQICQRLLPYKENLADELLRSLQVVLKLDARVADAYCEHITQEISSLIKANATHIRSQMGWRTITSLLSITARHPEASDAGFDALLFIMREGAHLLPANYILCTDASRQFAESRVGEAERSITALDLMAGSVDCLARWTHEAKQTMGEEEAAKMYQNIGEMWLRLVQGFRRVCLDQREDVRNHAVLSLQKSLTVADRIYLTHDLWLQCFDGVIFKVLDDLLEVAEAKSPKGYRSMEGTLVLAVKLLSKVFLQLLDDLIQQSVFSGLWEGVLSRMEGYMKVKIRGKRSEKLQELVPELLKNTLLVMKTIGVLVQKGSPGKDSFWEVTWLHVNNMAPDLHSEVLADLASKELHPEQVQSGGSLVPLETSSIHNENVASAGASS